MRLFISYSPHEFLEFENPKERYALLVERLQAEGYTIANPKLELTKYDGLSKKQLHIKISDELFKGVDVIFNYKPSFQQRYCYLHRRYARDFKIPTYVQQKPKPVKRDDKANAYEEWIASECLLPVSKLAKKHGVNIEELLRYLLEQNRINNPESIYNLFPNEDFSPLTEEKITHKKKNNRQMV